MELGAQTISITNIAVAIAKIFLWLFELASGFAVGVFGVLLVVYFFDIGFQGDMREAFKDYHDEMTRKILLATDEETPTVATWALEGYIDSIEDMFDPDDCDTWMPEALVFWYGRLALLRKKVGDMDGYSSNIDHSISIAKSCALDDLGTEGEVLEFLETWRFQ